MGGKVGERHTKTNRSSRFSTPILFPLLLFLLFLLSVSELRVVVTMKVFRSREKRRKERGKERRKEDRKEKAMNITISIANHKSRNRSVVRSSVRFVLVVGWWGRVPCRGSSPPTSPQTAQMVLEKWRKPLEWKVEYVCIYIIYMHRGYKKTGEDSFKLPSGTISGKENKINKYTWVNQRNVGVSVLLAVFAESTCMIHLVARGGFAGTGVSGCRDGHERHGG